MKIIKAILVFICTLGLHIASAREYPIDLAKAQQYFNEIKAFCDSDQGALWGENLWAPILIIDKDTRFVVASHPDNEGLLKQTGDVYTGYFPEDKIIANSTTVFGNEHWIMVMHPLPEDRYARNQLCVHELFHRLQGKLDLGFGNYSNDHMDNMDARILIKLEWLALEQAVLAEPSVRKEILTDALVFRNYRRTLYPGKDTMENRFEIHEGLAEYTGHAICSRNNEEFKQNILQTKEKNWNVESYVRSFAYYSGPLYGYLLDQGTPGWRAGIHPGSDLGELVRETFDLTLPADIEKSCEQARHRYDYEDILVVEEERGKKKQELLDAYRYRFTEDTVLVLYTPKPSISFDPRTLVPFDTLGTVYPTIRIVADWGILQVDEGGCLYDWKKAVVSGRGIIRVNETLSGNGWVLELTGSWNLTRKGRTYTLSGND